MGEGWPRGHSSPRCTWQPRWDLTGTKWAWTGTKWAWTGTKWAWTETKCPWTETKWRCTGGTSKTVKPCLWKTWDRETISCAARWRPIPGKRPITSSWETGKNMMTALESHEELGQNLRDAIKLYESTPATLGSRRYSNMRDAMVLNNNQMVGHNMREGQMIHHQNQMIHPQNQMIHTQQMRI